MHLLHALVYSSSVSLCMALLNGVSLACLILLSVSGSSSGAATCSDGIRNGFETGVDCGGPACAACALGANCIGNNDCQSGLYCNTTSSACATGEVGGQVVGMHNIW